MTNGYPNFKKRSLFYSTQKFWTHIIDSNIRNNIMYVLEWNVGPNHNVLGVVTVF
jgi:hypothetical protein